MNLLEKYQVRIDTSIRDSIKKMDVEDIDFLAVTDFKDKVIGVFTSGDFRESVLKGVDISESVETVVNKNFHYLEYGYEENIADNLFLEEMIAHIPVIKSGKLIDIGKSLNIPVLSAKMNEKKYKIDIPDLGITGNDGKKCYEEVIKLEIFQLQRRQSTE